MSILEPSFVLPPVRGRSAFALLATSMRRRGGRRSLTVISAVLLLAGVGLLSYPLFTNVYQSRRQAGLAHEAAQAGQAQAPIHVTIPGGPGAVPTYHAVAPPEGAYVTQLLIPDIDVDVYVPEGTSESDLRAGAGHYLETALPGAAGNVGIAGHRTTYGHPFNRLDELHPGSLATLITPQATYTYQAVPAADFGGANPHPVDPTDVAVLDQGPDLKATTLTQQWLTLTTCNPKGSAAQRLILRLALIRSVANPGHTLPVGTAVGSTAPVPSTGVAFSGGLQSGEGVG